MILLESLKRELLGENLPLISGIAGESEQNTRRAVEVIIPALVTRVFSTATTPSGAARLIEATRNAEETNTVYSSLGQALADGRLERPASMENPVVRAVLGTNTAGVIETLADELALRREVVERVVGVAAPLLMGRLGNLVRGLGNNPNAALMEVAGSNLSELRKEVPTRILSALGLSGIPTHTEPQVKRGGAPVFDSRPEAVEPYPLNHDQPDYLSRVLIALVAVGAVWYFTTEEREGFQIARQSYRNQAEANTAGDEMRGRLNPQAAARKVLRLPTGEVLRVQEGSAIDEIYTAITSTTIGEFTPYALEGVAFEGASAELSSRSAAQLNDLAMVLRAYPTARIRVAGYTDSGSDSRANLELSTQRAAAVKEHLTARGIDPRRVEIAGFGAERAEGTVVQGGSRLEVSLLQR